MQKTVETSTFGSELVAARIATDIAMEFRYNMRMMGFEVEGPVNMLGDNQSVILNTTIPSSQQLKNKKIQSCAKTTGLSAPSLHIYKLTLVCCNHRVLRRRRAQRRVKARRTAALHQNYCVFLLRSTRSIHGESSHNKKIILQQQQQQHYRSRFLETN
jgi:hypothetical protein